ncbi:glutathione peroxidase [Pseudoclavibacter endophyticus]|uniref:Glutathione peroxidase n=1 Tax=Pseudoclavibacter endophyticus TaxID=1778590 RepID=A0A6H9WS40_9MICO|nr:glutathione peroxidase [Pseudoclavibacter endophyticus]KAB1649747.1 glutathione peroxidase [Pseudoclavibacter endophyticus]GGA60069.1 glutathione peroxidase [Pseudoclavibacter endophyticus]
MSTIHDFQAASLDGTPVDLGDYRGKVLLIVNTASKCGFAPQFAGLDELHRKYCDRGFAVLGFPSNQFRQEPGTSEQIGELCSTRFNVSFPMFAKVDVNGADSHPVWAWLKHERKGVLSSAIKWNFTKFLVGRDGHVIHRYPPNAEPETLRHDIEKALKAPSESAAA